MRKCAVYARVPLPTQHISTQLLQLEELAKTRGFEVVAQFEDVGVSGTKARRPGLDALMAASRRSQFDILLVAAFDRLAKSTPHLLQTIQTLGSLGIDFISLREEIDTTGPMGRFFLSLIESLSGLNGELVREKIRRGMHRRRLEGFRLGRTPLSVDHQSLVRDRRSGMSLTQVSKKYCVSRASVVRFCRESAKRESLQAPEFQPTTAYEPAECLA